MAALKFGLIGAGSSATNIATSVSNMEEAEIIAVASRTYEHAAKLAQDKNIPKVYKTYRELLDDNEVEAVIISVPHGEHYRIVMDSLEKGKHVLCEKPLAINMEQGNEMVEKAEAKGLILGTFFQMRYQKASLKAKELIDSGALGRLLHAQVHVLWYRDEEYYAKSSWRGRWESEGGGSLINQSSHSIDLMTWLVGKPKVLFGVYGAKTHNIEVDDNAAALVIFENDVYGTIQTSTSCKPGYTNSVNIFGDKGGIFLVGNKLKWTKEDGSVEEFDFEKSQVGSENDPRKFSMDAHIALLKDYVDAVRNKRPPKVDGREGLRAIQIIRAIYESNGEKIIKFD